MSLFRRKKQPTPKRFREPPARRLETARERQAPGFLIVGTQRGGTTSLYEYLVQHPGVGGSWRKEVHYFDDHHDRGWDWYRAFFPREGRFQITGEASPYYLFDPAVPARVRAALPEARLIALLRNPVERAFSQYKMTAARGTEDLGFSEALEAEDERLAGEPHAKPAWNWYSYRRRGYYAEQLERWLDEFPREQLLILKSEELAEEPERIVLEAHEFLGLEPTVPEDLTQFHRRESPEMDPAVRERLAAHFAPHNRKLYELLGRDFGWEAEG